MKYLVVESEARADGLLFVKGRLVVMEGAESKIVIVIKSLGIATTRDT